MHAQIFTGFMYMAAAISMWFLRAWKIGEIEQVAAEQGKVAEEVDVTIVESQQGTFNAASARRTTKSRLWKRLFAWRRV